MERLLTRVLLSRAPVVHGAPFRHCATGKLRIDLLKKLRAETGASVIHARAALVDAENDLDRAREILRSKQAKSIAKKQGGDAGSEGVVASQITSDNRVGALVRLSCQTDFVARTERFRETAREACSKALESDWSLEELNAACELRIRDAVGALGEKITLTHAVRVVAEPDKTVLSNYIHNTLEPGVGRIGALVALDSDAAADGTKRERIQGMGRYLAMQVAAMAPEYMDVDDIPVELTKAHLKVLQESLQAEGESQIKAEAEALAGTRSLVEEKALLEQPFVIDQSGKAKVRDALSQWSDEIGANVQVRSFHRFTVV